MCARSNLARSIRAGGFLLSRGLSGEIIDRMRAASVVMQAGVRVVPMAQRTLDFARVIDSPDPAWRAENAPIAESAVVLDRVTLEAKNLGAIVRSSIELLDDTPSAGELLRNELGPKWRKPSIPRCCSAKADFRRSD